MAKGKKPDEEPKPQPDDDGKKGSRVPQRAKVHTPELLKAYRIAADLKELPPDADAKVEDAWKLKQSDLKGFHQSLRQQEDAFRKAWQDEKNRLDALREKERQEGRAAEARKLEAESEARRDAPPAELVDAAGPTLVLIDRVLGEYAT